MIGRIGGKVERILAKNLKFSSLNLLSDIMSWLKEKTVSELGDRSSEKK